ncbi:hypothetical protein [Mycoplasmoides pirum]|uniref:hypothetical protein n=1 Tax=Mycoplasmoides pirum TaxID=2122 RepID=UPI000481CC07|nr:hypothetical protein [Mycoplasmoides pirum]
MLNFENIFLLPKENTICELHHLSFAIWKIAKNYDESLVNSTLYLKFSSYSRKYIDNPTSKITWTYISKNLWEKSERFYGAINFNNFWIYSNKITNHNKKFFNYIRVIDDTYFLKFKNRDNHLILKDLNNSSLKYVKKHQSEFISKISRPTFFQKINIINSLVNEVSNYSNKWIKLFLKEFKSLNSKIFNNKEVNEKYLNSLFNEINDFQNSPLVSNDNLSKFWINISKVIESKFQSPIKTNEYFLMDELNFVKSNITATKYDIKNGYKNFHLYNFLKKILKIKIENKKNNFKKINLSKKIIRNWRKGLLIDLIYLYFKCFFTLKNKSINAFYKLNKYKTIDLLAFSKRLQKLIYLNCEETSNAISEIKKLISNYYDRISNDLKMDELSNKDPYSHNIYSKLWIKNKKHVFYQSINIHSLILNLYLQNSKKHAMMIQNQAYLDYQVQKNKSYLKHCKIFNNKNFEFVRFENSIFFKQGLSLIYKEYVNLLKHFIHQYSFIQGKTKSRNNFFFVKAQIFGFSNLLKDFRDLGNFLHNSEWKNSLYSWALSLNLLIVKYFNHYKNRIFDFFQNEKEQLVDFALYEKDYLIKLNRWLLQNKLDSELHNFCQLLKKHFEISTNTYEKYAWNENFKNLNKEELNKKLNLLKSSKRRINKNINIYKHNYKYNWRAKYVEQLITINNGRKLLNQFEKVGKNLIKKINIVNFAAKKQKLKNNDYLDSNSIYKLIISNLHILNMCYRLINSLKYQKILCTNYQAKKILYKYYATKQLNSMLKSFEMKFLITYGDYKKIDNLDFFKLYLIKEFLYDPNLVIISNITTNNLHEYNTIKGLLLKQQNKQKFALIFLDNESKLSKDLAMQRLI